MSADTLHASAVAALEALDAVGPDADSARQAVLSFLAATPNGCLREQPAGHVTASAIVLSADGARVLLTLHPRVGRWVQLGGHCEPTDETVFDAARREAAEESGIEGIVFDPEPLGLHVHPITCSLGVPTRHLDLRWVGYAPEGAEPVISAESLDLAWWPVAALPDEADHETLAPLLARAAQRRARR